MIVTHVSAILCNLEYHPSKLISWIIIVEMFALHKIIDNKLFLIDKLLLPISLRHYLFYNMNVFVLCDPSKRRHQKNSNLAVVIWS